MNVKLMMAIIVAAHGIGHIMGVMTIPMGMFGESGFKQGSWLLSDRLGLNTSTVRALGMLWLIATLAFMAVAYGYFYDLTWWRTLIKASVILSVVLFVAWWDAFPANIPIQANLGNVAAIIALYLNA